MDPGENEDELERSRLLWDFALKMFVLELLPYFATCGCGHHARCIAIRLNRIERVSKF